MCGHKSESLKNSMCGHKSEFLKNSMCGHKSEEKTKQIYWYLTDLLAKNLFQKDWLFSLKNEILLFI